MYQLTFESISYLPAFFLQRLVAFLEHVPETDPGAPPRSLAWGYVFCLGLLASALMDAVVSGQLWFGAFRSPHPQVHG